VTYALAACRAVVSVAARKKVCRERWRGKWREVNRLSVLVEGCPSSTSWRYREGCCCLLAKNKAAQGVGEGTLRSMGYRSLTASAWPGQVCRLQVSGEDSSNAGFGFLLVQLTANA
jgi:hypothetical protein